MSTLRKIQKVIRRSAIGICFQEFSTGHASINVAVDGSLSTGNVGAIAAFNPIYHAWPIGDFGLTGLFIQPLIVADSFVRVIVVTVIFSYCDNSYCHVVSPPDRLKMIVFGFLFNDRWTFAHR
jgi:hypothetical protein